MLRKLLIAAVAASAVTLAGCSGGGSGSGPSASSGGGQVAAATNPLATVQSTMLSSVIQPLESASAGTPLTGVLACGNSALNLNQLNALGSLINGFQNSTQSPSTTATQVQAQLTAFTQSLTGLLTSFASSTGTAGSATCATSSSSAGSNPLAGTPLATFGMAFQQAIQQLQLGLANAGTGSGGSSSSTALATFASLYSTFNDQLQKAIALIPAAALQAPVFGGTIMTFKQLSPEFLAVLQAAANNDPTTFNQATQTYINDFIVDYLTLIVPTAYFETQVGQPGVITGPIDSAAAQASAAFVQALAPYTQDYLTALNSSALAPVFAPINQFLPSITSALSNAGTGGGLGGTGGTGATGTPLDSILTPLTTALQSLASGAGTGSGTACFPNYPKLAALFCP